MNEFVSFFLHKNVRSYLATFILIHTQENGWKVGKKGLLIFKVALKRDGWGSCTENTSDVELWLACLSRLHRLSPGSLPRWACSLIWRGTQGSGLNNESNMNLPLNAAKNGLPKTNGMRSNKVKWMMDKYNKCFKKTGRGREGHQMHCWFCVYYLSVLSCIWRLIINNSNR